MSQRAGFADVLLTNYEVSTVCKLLSDLQLDCACQTSGAEQLDYLVHKILGRATYLHDQPVWKKSAVSASIIVPYGIRESSQSPR